MPKEKQTLKDLIAKIKQKPLKTNEVVPGLFSGSRFKVVMDRDPSTVPVVWGEEHIHAKRYGTHFGAAMGESPQQVAHRAMAYGQALAGRDYIPYALEKNKEMDKGWVEFLRMATGASLMADAEVEEIEQRDFYPVAPNDSVYHTATNAMYSIGTPQEPIVLREAKEILKKLGYKRQAALLKSMLYGAIEAAKSKTDLVAHLLALQELFGTEAHQNPQQPGKQPGDKDGDEAIAKMISMNYDPDHLGSKPEQTHNNRPPKWGTMEYQELPLTEQMAQSKKSKVWKRAGVGAFRFPWRALKTSDLQCFAVKRKQYGGTLLFDISGSMRITPEHIKTILEHSPEATMAAYGGHDNDKGRLVLMAKDGMAADPKVVRYSVGSGNVVDGPALEWLCEQPEPRIWISDGGATGLNDECDESHQAYCYRLAEENRITRIESADQLVDLLKARTS